MAQLQEEYVKKRETTYKVNPYSQSFKDWFLNRIQLGRFINYHLIGRLSPQYQSPKLIKDSFVTGFKTLLTHLFPFDGYDTRSQEITYHNNKKGPVYKDHQFGWLTLLAFFGLPTRPYAVKAKDGTLNPKLTGIDVVVNLFGGWKSPWLSLTREQLIAQLIALITVKPFVILPLNVVTGLVKLFQNIVKLVIFVPLFFVQFILFNIFHFLLTSTHKVAFSDWHPILKVPATIILGLVSLSSLIDIPILICNRIMMAIILPLASIRYHLAKGREVEIFSYQIRKFQAKVVGNYDPNVPPADQLADLIGYTSALVSFAITAIAWAIILSLAIGAVMTFFPALIPAVVATFGWVAHLPFITTIYGAAQSVLGITLIPNIIGLLTPIISTLSAFLGLQISLTLLTSAATVGFSAALIGVPLTYAANKFSNWYVSWYGTQSATRVLIQKKSAVADDFDPESDDKDDSADIELANKKLLEARSTEQQASVEGRKDSTNKGAAAPRDDAQHLVTKVNLSRVQTDHREQQATAKGSAVETSLQPQGQRTGLFNKDTDQTKKAKALLENEIGNRYKIGEAFSRGDCFYDAFAQGLNQLNRTGTHTMRSLRTDCANTVHGFMPDSAELEWLQKLIPNQADLAAYNMKVGMTADECQDNDLALDKHAIWGTPNIDGVILCKKYKVNLHVIEVHNDKVEDDSDGEDDTRTLEYISHRLITPDGKSKIVDLAEIPETETISIVNYHQHFVPAFPTNHLQINNTKF